MDKNQLSQLLSQISSLELNIPSGADLFTIESSLEHLIKAVERQNELSEVIIEKLEEVNEYMPSSSTVSTSQMENSLEQIHERLGSMEDELSEIASNTR